MASSARPAGARGARAEATGRDASVATFLTWFLPGAGHVYLGRRRTALLAFLVVEGLYALGWALSDGRTFEFLDPELRGPFATALAPEVANLGAMVLQLQRVGFGPSVPSPFPDAIALGGILTALSGLVNVCFMVHANLEARLPAVAPARRGPHPAVLVGLGWAVPGLGHVLQGRRRRGAIVFALLVGLFLWGTYLAQGSNLSRERHFYYWSGQFLLGLPALASELAVGSNPVEGEIPHVDVGLLYACMAGLLNVMALLDVHGVAERRLLGTEGATAAPVAETGGGA